MEDFATAFVEEAQQQLTQEQQQRLAEEAKERQRQAVQALIQSRLRDAVQAKENSGIEQIWLDDEDQYNGYDEANPPQTGAAVMKEPSTKVERAGKRSTVFVNITKPKTDTAVSRVQEMLVPTDDKPWEIGPTPVPELEAAAQGLDNRTVMLADGTPAQAKDVAKVAKEKARMSAERMSDQIEDWYEEGGVYSEWRKSIREAGRIGSGVVKGPFPVLRRDKKWSVEGGVAELVVKERLAPTSRCISPWDLFPDPSCGDNIHNGAYIFERDFITGRKLRALADLPGYDRARIAAILKAGPKKRSRADRYMRQKPGETPDFDTGTFEVHYYYGDIPPDVLIAGEFQVVGLTHDAEGNPAKPEELEKALQLSTVSIMATLVNEELVRITMNPLETGEFPYDVFAWEPVEGQPWGRGIPRKMAVAQKMLNAATRAMLENAGMSAGPQIVVAKNIIEPWDGNYVVQGRKGWYFKPTEKIDDVRKAFASVMIDSAQQQLQAIIDYSLRMADELSNLPLLLQGAVGSAPDTVGGMAMLQANATSPLKAIAKCADDSLFLPHTKRYYAWGMQDPAVPAEAKGDFQCKARGATALMARDAAAQILPNIVPASKDPAFGLDPEKTMAAALRSNKVDPDALALTPEQKQALADAQQQQPQDPKIAAEQIRAADRAEDRKQKAQEAELDRQHELVIKEIEREIQVLEFSGQREISLADIKAMLAKTAMDIRTKRELQANELAYASTHGEGI